jgi:hypothetical protein
MEASAILGVVEAYARLQAFLCDAMSFDDESKLSAEDRGMVLQFLSVLAVEPARGVRDRPTSWVPAVLSLDAPEAFTLEQRERSRANIRSRGSVAMVCGAHGGRRPPSSFRSRPVNARDAGKQKGDR